ncbi:MAG TPA: hypothetical protein PLN69_12210 [bacterium]|nr:hypothetical protein [bacterium]
MKSYYLLVILIFLVYVYSDFVREAQRGKKNYSIYALLSAIATLGLCVYLAVAGLVKAGVFEPFWFEDIL